MDYYVQDGKITFVVILQDDLNRVLRVQQTAFILSPLPMRNPYLKLVLSIPSLFGNPWCHCGCNQCDANRNKEACVLVA